MITLSPLVRGCSRDYPIIVTQADGSTFGAPPCKPSPFDGTETLISRLWSGDDTAIILNPVATWIDPITAKVQVSFNDPDTINLIPAKYRLQVLASQGGRSIPIVEAYLPIDYAPGLALAAPSYTTYNDLLTVGRTAIKKLQMDDDQVGFAEDQGRAREWLDEIIMSHFQPSNIIQLGDPGYSAYALGLNPGAFPSVWLRGMLDANALIVRPQIRSICAYKACSYVMEGQVGVGDGSEKYRALANRFSNEASALVKCTRAEIDPAGSGWPILAINLGAYSLRG